MRTLPWIVVFLVGLLPAPLLAAGDFVCPEGSAQRDSDLSQGLRMECVRPEGERHGAFQELHPNGGVRQVGSFVNGRESGLWQKFHLNGTLRNEARFRGGVLHGVMRSWYEDGTLNEVGFVWNGQLHGKAFGFHGNGKVGEIGWYLFDAREGLWESYNEGGSRVVAEEYRRGKADGMHRSWDPDGVLRAEGRHQAGGRVGRWTVWTIANASPVIEHHTKETPRKEGPVTEILRILQAPISPEARSDSAPR